MISQQVRFFRHYLFDVPPRLGLRLRTVSRYKKHMRRIPGRWETAARRILYVKHELFQQSAETDATGYPFGHHNSDDRRALSRIHHVRVAEYHHNSHTCDNWGGSHGPWGRSALGAVWGITCTLKALLAPPSPLDGMIFRNPVVSIVRESL